MCNKTSSKKEISLLVWWKNSHDTHVTGRILEGAIIHLLLIASLLHINATVIASLPSFIAYNESRH